MSFEALRPVRTNRFRRWFVRNALLAVIIALLLVTFRTVVAASFRPTSDAVAPEIPQGARV